MNLEASVVLAIAAVLAAPPAFSAAGPIVTHHDGTPITFSGFKSHPEPSFVSQLTALLERESARAGFSASQGWRPIPEAVSRRFNALTLQQRLEFAIYRYELERPSTRRRVLEIARYAHDGLEETVAAMLSPAADPEYNDALLHVIVWLSIEPGMGCRRQLQSAILRVAESLPQDKQSFVELELPDVFASLRCTP